jgi:putative transposase
MYRLYSEEQLQLRSKLPRRRKMVVTRQAKIKPVKPNEAWSMDFVSDQLANGMRFRTLTIVDVFSKEALAIEVGQRLRSDHVVAALNRLVAHRGPPQYLFVDNGAEFSGQLLDLWAYHHKARIDFSRPGKPTDNCHIETFNGSFRDECLNLHWFETLEEAKAIIEDWRRDYNESRPHSTLNDLSPAEFVRQAGLPSPMEHAETRPIPLYDSALLFQFFQIILGENFIRKVSQFHPGIGKNRHFSGAKSIRHYQTSWPLLSQYGLKVFIPGVFKQALGQRVELSPIWPKIRLLYPI